MSYIALWDKDITYEHIMDESEEQSYYKTRDFTGLTDEGSYLPTPALRVRRLIKKNFQYLYHKTQRGWTFGWHTFKSEVLNSVFVSVFLCVFGYEVYSGTSALHIKGYSADFWMASFTIYSGLIYFTNAVLVARAGEITWLFVGFVTIGSLLPFIFLALTYDTVLTGPNPREYVIFNVAQVHHYYLLCLVLVFVPFAIEIIKILYKKYTKPTLIDYFNHLIKEKKDEDPEKFKPEIIESFIRLHDPIPDSKTAKRRLSKLLSMENPSSQLEGESGGLERRMSHKERIDGNTPQLPPPHLTIYPPNQIPEEESQLESTPLQKSSVHLLKEQDSPRDHQPSSLISPNIQTKDPLPIIKRGETHKSISNNSVVTLDYGTGSQITMQHQENKRNMKISNFDFAQNAQSHQNIPVSPSESKEHSKRSKMNVSESQQNNIELQNEEEEGIKFTHSEHNDSAMKDLDENPEINLPHFGSLRSQNPTPR